MCGIIGIVSRQSVAQIIYDGLLVLQHRGQDSADGGPDTGLGRLPPANARCGRLRRRPRACL